VQRFSLATNAERVCAEIMRNNKRISSNFRDRRNDARDVLRA
jgi:hypothetical protein